MKHKQKVLKYITFETSIKIGNDYFTVTLTTERVKGQAPDLLDLYNISVKRKDLPDALSNPIGLNALPQGLTNNTTDTENVNNQDENSSSLNFQKITEESATVENLQTALEKLCLVLLLITRKTTEKYTHD